jgi:hypothetical protein
MIFLVVIELPTEKRVGFHLGFSASKSYGLEKRIKKMKMAKVTLIDPLI